MSSYYPVATALENQLKNFNNPVAEMLKSLVREYEFGAAGDVDMVFHEELLGRLKQICAPEELKDFCLRLYASVARDIAMCAEDNDAIWEDARQESFMQAILVVFETNGNGLDDNFDPTELLSRMARAGWKTSAADASGRTLLHHLVGDETIDSLIAGNAIEWLLNHGADVNAIDKHGVTPLHLAAATGFGIVDTLLASGADKTLRTTSPAQISLYAARGSVTIPAGSSAHDLAKESNLSEEVIDALACDVQ